MEKRHPVLRMITQRIKTNKNWMVLIQGETGCGKSYVALRLGEIIDKNFSINNVVFTPQEFSSLLASGNLKAGSVVIFDEAGVGMSSKEWATRSNKLISNITQTFRTNRLVVIFTLPSGKFLDSSIKYVFHALIEPLGVQEGTNQNAFKLLKIEQNYRQNKTYYPYYRFKDDKTGRFFKYAIIRIGKPTDKLCDEYEDKRGSYLGTLQTDLKNWTTTGKRTRFGEEDKKKETKMAVNRDELKKLFKTKDRSEVFFGGEQYIMKPSRAKELHPSISIEVIKEILREAKSELKRGI
jgi:ABC-type dipeptide/oligopeptide/nickel transport system ATPase component